jgi:4-amino-4-deoxychorismate lyase
LNTASILVNGRPRRTVDVLDRGFQYGDGVFTTIAVRAGIPLFLDRHLDRLQRDCAAVGMPWVGKDTLLREVEQVLTNQGDGVLKIQLTRGVGGRGYRPPASVAPTRVIALHPSVSYPASHEQDGVVVRLCSTPLGINPCLAGIKHMNRLEQILARSEWGDSDYAEGLMFDQDDQLVEGTMSNVFLVRDGRLLTPVLDRCGIQGVMRSILIEAARGLGFEVYECRLTAKELERADEVFLSNSVIGLWPVRRVEGRAYEIGSITRRMREWLKTSTQQAISAGFPG